MARIVTGLFLGLNLAAGVARAEAAEVAAQISGFTSDGNLVYGIAVGTDFNEDDPFTYTFTSGYVEIKETTPSGVSLLDTGDVPISNPYIHPGPSDFASISAKSFYAPFPSETNVFLDIVALDNTHNVSIQETLDDVGQLVVNYGQVGQQFIDFSPTITITGQFPFTTEPLSPPPPVPSPVPLPDSAAMFGTAILALGIVGSVLKGKRTKVQV